ncbi:MAG TPA: hypothetical protein VGC54_00205 [Planctomycetota bacterium]
MQRSQQQTSNFRLRRTLNALPALALLALAPAAAAQGSTGDAGSAAKLAPQARRGNADVYSAADLAGTWVGQLQVAGRKDAGLLFRARFDAQGEMIDLVDATGRTWDASNSVIQVDVTASGLVRIRMQRVGAGHADLELLGALDAVAVKNAGVAKFTGHLSEAGTDPLNASGPGGIGAQKKRTYRFDDSGLYQVGQAGNGSLPQFGGLEERFHSPDGLEGEMGTPKGTDKQRRKDEDIVWPADPNYNGDLHRPTDPGSLDYCFCAPRSWSYELVRVVEIDPQMPKALYETWFTARGIIAGPVELGGTDKQPRNKDLEKRDDVFLPPPTQDDRKDMDVFRAGRLEGGIYLAADGTQWVLRFGLIAPHGRFMQGVVISLESGEARFIQAQRRLRDADAHDAN